MAWFDQAWVAVPAIIASVAAPVLSFALAARARRGDVAVSSADELWMESRSIRDDYRERLVLAYERISTLDAENDRIAELNTDLRIELARLQKNGQPTTKERLGHLEDRVTLEEGRNTDIEDAARELKARADKREEV